MPLPPVMPIVPPAREQQERFIELCEWIEANLDAEITWGNLVNASGWSHQELIHYFNYFLQTTPMTFVRNARIGDALGFRPVQSVLPRPLIR